MEGNFVFLCHFIDHQVSLSMNLTIFKQIKSDYGINYSKESVSNCCYWRYQCQDIKMVDRRGLKIQNLLSQFSLSQVINEPTHTSQNFNSCIDLLFINHQNIATDSGIYPSLHSNCHHQIIYGKFNLRIFYPVAL